MGVTAEARNKRMRENKWLRWKYIEELNQKDGWLDEQGGGDMGWAVGRRIYDKDEIEKVDERMKSNQSKSSMFNKGQNVSLKEAKKMFGLWDNCYNTNAV